MANNKFYGYTPDPTKEKEGNRLDRLNPYEFKKGMDIELTDMGVERLRESTPEEREKATEIVIKNLQEHGGYYSGLVQFKGGMNHGSKITETNFKKWLESYMPGDAGTGMVEVNTEIKTDKMTELKEAIKSEIKNILSEFDAKAVKQMNKDTEKQDKEPSKKDMKGVSKDSAVQARKDIDAAKSDLAKAEEERSKHFATYKKAKAKAKNDNAEAAAKNAFKPRKGRQKVAEAEAKTTYVQAIQTLQNTINDKKAEIKKLTDSLTDISEDRKKLRREVAKTMMDKDTHLEILKIVKEAGVSLREGSAPIKMYYEIAKTAYQEGFMSALDKNQE